MFNFSLAATTSPLINLVIEHFGRTPWYGRLGFEAAVSTIIAINIYFATQRRRHIDVQPEK